MAKGRYDLTIDQKALTAIKEAVKGRSAEELKKVGDDSALLLKKYAADYLTYAKKYAEGIQRIKALSQHISQLEKKIKNLEEKDEKIVGQIKNDTNKLEKLKEKYKITQSFLKRSMQFNDNILKIITERESYITVVLPNGKNGHTDVFVAQVPLEKIFEEGTGISVTGYINDQGKIKTKIILDIEEMYNNLTDYIQHNSMLGENATFYLNQTYRSAVGNYNKHNPYVFWKGTQDKNWSKMKIVGGKGDLAEAYASFFYQGENSYAAQVFNASHHLYDRLAFFFIEGVGAVDAVSGLLTADVLTDKLALAVKSTDASIAGIVQMIDLANKIIKDKVKNVSQLKKISEFAQWDTTGDEPIRKGLRNFIEEVLDSSNLT